MRMWLSEISLLRLTGAGAGRVAAVGGVCGGLGDGEDKEGPVMLALLRRGEEVCRN